MMIGGPFSQSHRAVACLYYMGRFFNPPKLTRRTCCGVEEAEFAVGTNATSVLIAGH